MTPAALQAALPAAVSAASPSGLDLVFSADFDRLAELRRQDDASLDQGEWVAEFKRADWPAVMRLCEALLADRSKDLRVAAWWAEAAAHVDGFGGLADGLDLYAGLCNAFWDTVHPLPEGDDFELRIGSLGWLLAQVRTLCRTLPVLQLGEKPLSLADIEAARRRSSSSGGGGAHPTARDNADDSGSAGRTPAVATAEALSRALRALPVPAQQALLEGARRLPTAVSALQAATDDRLGADGPSFALAREAAAAAVEGIERLVRDAGISTALEQPQAVAAAPAGSRQGHDGPVDAPSSSSALTGVAVAPQHRAQALAQLRLVAEFFRRTEPHSPVAYLADRAARWGEMPLHEWLRTVLKEPGSLAQLEELLGVPPPSPDAADGG